MIAPIQLPYAYNALEPYYDEETLRIHYDKLYKGYIDNLNKTEEKLQRARNERNFENIKCLERDLSYNGSGVILHELFFTNMATKGTRRDIMLLEVGPSSHLLRQMDNDFGGFENFKAQFMAAAKNVEASRLVLISVGYKVQQVSNIAMRKTSKSNTLGLHSNISSRYVGTFIFPKT